MNHAARVKKLEEAISPPPGASPPCEKCGFPQTAAFVDIRHVGRPTDPPEEAPPEPKRCPECERLLNSHGHPFAEGETIKRVTIIHEEDN